jgi:8-oxo-dGTP pyrophosphatase MutT (NUDIX family)
MSSAAAGVRVELTDRRLQLSPETAQLVEAHWEAVHRRGQVFRRGVVYAVTQKLEQPAGLLLRLSHSDYAHFLWSLNGNRDHPDHAQVVYACTVLKTSDACFVLGEMNAHTCTPGRLQLAGGGLDMEDFTDGVLDSSRCAARELEEEIGIALTEAPTLRYIKEGGEDGFVGLIHRCTTPLTAQAVSDRFRHHVAAMPQPELKNLVIVPATPEAVRSFIASEKRPKVDYLDKLLELETSLQAPAS